MCVCVCVCVRVCVCVCMLCVCVLCVSVCLCLHKMLPFFSASLAAGYPFCPAQKVFFKCSIEYSHLQEECLRLGSEGVGREGWRKGREQ